MKRNLLVLAVMVAVVAPSAMAQEVINGPRQINGGITITATAGSGGVTAKLLASKDTSNPTAYVIPGSGGCGSGIAATTASAAATFQLYVVPGLVLTGVADNTITAGDILVGGTGTPGRVRDSGQTSRSAIANSVCIVGVAQENKTVGQDVLFRYDGAGTAGMLAGIRQVRMTFSNGGSALTAGTTVPLYAWCDTVLAGGTVESWDARVDTGTATFKVWRGTSSTADPGVSASLNTSGVGVSTGTTVHSTTFSDFTGGTAPVFADLDKVCIQLSAVSGSPTQASFAINYR